MVERTVVSDLISGSTIQSGLRIFPAGSSMPLATISWAIAASLIISFFSILANESAFLGIIDRETVTWIHGYDFGYPMRVLQLSLFSIILPPLAEGALFLYALPMLLLHLFNGILLCLLFRALFSANLGEAPAWLGGIVAGLVLSTSPVAKVTVSWFCSISHVMVSFFALLMLICSLRFLRHGRARYWLFVLLFYELSLLSNSLALGLPFFLLLFEGSVTGWRSMRSARAGFAVRYSTLGLVLAVHISIFQDEYLEAISRAKNAPSTMSGYAHEFINYLTDALFLVIRSADNSFSRMHDHSQVLNRSYVPMVAVGTILVMVVGAYQMFKGKGRLPAFNVLLLFPLCWMAMAFPQLVSHGSDYEVGKIPPRFMYFVSIGVALSFAFLLSWRPRSLTRSRLRSVRIGLNGACQRV